MDLQDIEFLDQKQKFLEANPGEESESLMEVIEGLYNALVKLENAEHDESDGITRAELMESMTGILIETMGLIFENTENMMAMIDEAHVFYLIQADKTKDEEFTKYAYDYSERVVALKEVVGIETASDKLLRTLVKERDYMSLSDSDEGKQE